MMGFAIVSDYLMEDTGKADIKLITRMAEVPTYWIL